MEAVVVPIGEAYERGRRAWPDIALDRRVFDDYAAERLDVAEPEGVHAEDLFLACACARAEPSALAAFDTHHLSQVPIYLAGMATSSHFVDEVRQLLRERLFVDGKIRLYSGRGKLSSWLRVVTLRVALNARDGNDPPGASTDLLPSTAIDPELAVIQERYGDAFNAALRDALARLSGEHRTLLRLHYVDGLNIGKIALVFGVSRATIGRRVIEVRERVYDDVVAAVRTRLDATPAEIESLLRLVRSGLAISLSAILGER